MGQIYMQSADALAQTSLYQFLMNLLYGIAKTRSPLLNLVFSLITYLGHEVVFIVVGMLLIWCVNKKYGYRFMSVFMVGNLLNQFLKALFMVPRPWVVDPDFRVVGDDLGDSWLNAKNAATGFSFPSGHAQSACMTLGGVAIYLKKWWGYLLAAVLTVLVAYSRMYLGVHTLLDVAVGLVLGILTLVLVNALFHKLCDSNKSFAVLLILGNLLCAAMVLFLLASPAHADSHSLKNAYVLLGTTMGFTFGWFFDAYVVKFETKAVWWVQIIKLVLGGLLVIGVRLGLKSLFKALGLTMLDENGERVIYPVLDGVRYLVMTFLALGIYPMLFAPLQKLGERKAAQQA